MLQSLSNHTFLHKKTIYFYFLKNSEDVNQTQPPTLHPETFTIVSPMPTGKE